MANPDKQPRALREWTREIEGGELFRLIVFDDETVCSEVGPYAHWSGSRACTWMEFLNGSLNGVVSQEFGPEVLDDALGFVRSEVRDSAC